MNQVDQNVCLDDTWKLVQEINTLGLLAPNQLEYFQSLSWEGSQIKAYLTNKEYILEQIQKIFVKNTIISGDIYYKNLTFFIQSEG